MFPGNTMTGQDLGYVIFEHKPQSLTRLRRDLGKYPVLLCLLQQFLQTDICVPIPRPQNLKWETGTLFRDFWRFFQLHTRKSGAKRMIFPLLSHI